MDEMGFIERFTSASVSLVEHPMAPGVLGSPVHTHSQEDELSYILEGTVQALVGDQVLTAVAGGYIWKPRGVSHAFWNPGPTPARVLEIITPGAFAGYFRELLAAVRAGGGAPDRDAMAAAAERYRLDMDYGSIEDLCSRFGVRLPRM